MNLSKVLKEWMAWRSQLLGFILCRRRECPSRRLSGIFRWGGPLESHEVQSKHCSVQFSRHAAVEKKKNICRRWERLRDRSGLSILIHFPVFSFQFLKSGSLTNYALPLRSWERKSRKMCLESVCFRTESTNSAVSTSSRQQFEFYLWELLKK